MTVARRLRLLLEYDGSDFEGWQIQASARTVQGTLERAIAEVTREEVRVVAAGRTDAGVHARGQTAHFDSRSRLSPAELRRALNAVLPEDVAVLELREAPPDFHARHDALSKRYDYRILTGGTPSPLRRRVTWSLRSWLDLSAMREGAATLRGSHDFAAFRGAPGGPPPNENTRRTLDRLDLMREGDELRLVFEARSFLRHMVRNLVGTLVEVGQRRRGPEDLAGILESRERSRAGPTAPARGLCLEAVCYPDAGPEGRDESPGGPTT